MTAAPLARVQKWGFSLLAIILVLVGAYAAGGRASKRAVEIKLAEEDAARMRAATKGTRDAKQEVSNLPSGGAADELRRDWMRDDD